MVLDRKSGDLKVPDPLNGLVVEVDVSDLHLLTGSDKRIRINDEPVILGCDLDLSRGQIFYGMVSPMMSELQLEGDSTKGQPEYLVAETDPEDGYLAQKFLHASHSVSDRFRITRAVGQETPSGSSSRILSDDVPAGTTVTLQPTPVSSLRIFLLIP